MAAKHAVDHLDTIADKFEIDEKNPEQLIQIAMTTLGSKIIKATSFNAFFAGLESLD